VDVYEFFPIMDGDEVAMQDLFSRYCQFKKNIKKGSTVDLYPSNQAFLNKGLLKVYMSNAAGNERLMWYIREKNAIPYNCSFGKRVVSETDSEIIYIKREEYLDYIRSSRDNLQNYIKWFHKRYYYCMQQILNENSYSCERKIYSFIYQLAKVIGNENENGQIVIDDLPSRKDIASIVGTHRSNATRYITKLEKNDIVKKQKGSIIVKDLEALKQLIDRSF
jgi:hypothetical protein